MPHSYCESDDSYGVPSFQNLSSYRTDDTFLWVYDIDTGEYSYNLERYIFSLVFVLLT